MIHLSSDLDLKWTERIANIPTPAQSDQERSFLFALLARSNQHCVSRRRTTMIIATKRPEEEEEASVVLEISIFSSQLRIGVDGDENQNSTWNDLGGLRIADFQSESDKDEHRPDERMITVAMFSDSMVFRSTVNSINCHS